MNISKRQQALVITKLYKRGFTIPRGSSYETICKCIATALGAPCPKTLEGQCTLILDFLYDRIGRPPIEPMVPLKPQKGMAEALRRCAEYRYPSWFDKNR